MLKICRFSIRTIVEHLDGPFSLPYFKGLTSSTYSVASAHSISVQPRETVPISMNLFNSLNFALFIIYHIELC